MDTNNFNTRGVSLTKNQKAFLSVHSSYLTVTMDFNYLRSMTDDWKWDMGHFIGGRTWATILLVKCVQVDDSILILGLMAIFAPVCGGRVEFRCTLLFEAERRAKGHGHPTRHLRSNSKVGFVRRSDLPKLTASGYRCT